MVPLETTKTKYAYKKALFDTMLFYMPRKAEGIEQRNKRRLKSCCHDRHIKLLWREVKTIVLLSDIRDYVAGLNIAEDANCYCGIPPDKQSKPDKSIGVCNLKSDRTERTPHSVIGGDKNSSYEIKGISFTIHWNGSLDETEKTALDLYKVLKATKNVTVNGHSFICVEMVREEPVPVGMDENGIFEYAIECFFYVRKDV